MWLSVDKNNSLPLTRQIYEAIRGAILSGELQAGERLPSSRQTALTQRISRNVVTEAYEQLMAEGYLVTRQGAGTFVAADTFLENWHPKFKKEKIDKQSIKEDIIDFRSGLPAVEYFPRKKWGRLMQKICLTADASAFGYSMPHGSLELRTVLCRYLRRTRGVDCSPEQIVITSGTTQALSLISRLLVRKGAKIVLEDPTNIEIPAVFSVDKSELIHIPVDEYGIRPELIPREDIAFVFVTPSHQYPLGGVLPIQRRLELVRFARSNDTFIVEDDYDSEFRYDGMPVSSLQGLDRERVIYTGTFSKLLSPALRLGYVILPHVLVEHFNVLKNVSDRHSSYLEQIALTHFISEGDFDRHITRMKRIYLGRRNALIQYLHRHFAGSVRILGTATGLHLVAEFKDVVFGKETTGHLAARGVRIYIVEGHAFIKGLHTNKVILGYGHLSEDEIREGVNRMKTGIDLIS